jgi:nucleotide-binding universal stress UspA family protein
MTVVTPAPTRTGADDRHAPRAAPIVVAVEASPASHAAAEEAAILAFDLEAPLVFIYARRGPPGFLGTPFYQRRLTRDLERARRVLDQALRVAQLAGVEAEAEILEGSPRRRILDFARARDAQLVVVGSRRRRLGRSVSRAVARGADRPIVVASPRPSRLVIPRAA